MVVCIVCGSTSKLTKNRSFHVLPSDLVTKQRWIAFIRREKGQNIQVDEKTKLCSAHFRVGDITKRGKYHYINEGAVPVGLAELGASVSEFEYQHQSQDEETQGTSETSTPTEKGDSASFKFFTWTNITSNIKDLNFYTGFKHPRVFFALFEFFSPVVSQLPSVQRVSKERVPDLSDTRAKLGRPSTLQLQDEFLITMIRLRQDLPEKVIGDIFSLHESAVSKILNKWIVTMSQMLRHTDIWPTKESIAEDLPQRFSNYKNIRVIIDATEIEIEHPSSTIAQKETWSNYKNRNTVKGLIGISPRGQITFVSRLYGGRMSDKKIVNDCGVLDRCQPGDLMADRGFTISDECLKRDLQLITPYFMGSQEQFTDSQNKDSREIAKLRSMVERLIGSCKNFKILHNKIPLTMAPIVEDIWVVCNYLANFTPRVDDPCSVDSSEIEMTETTATTSSPPQTLRIVKWPACLMAEFLKIARPNTEKNVETMGYVLARMINDEFIVTDLVIPDQIGDANSCTTLDPDALSLFMGIEKYVVAWIHTHPTQTCFLSSLDLHTQFRLQSMTPECVAAVCPPKYNQRSILRVTDNYGMTYISKCAVENVLHDHPNQTDDLFCLASHVVTVDDMELNVLDDRIFD